MIKVIATDLDGTLLYPKRPFKLISTRNKRLFKKFYQQGGKIILVTARGPRFSQLIAKRLGVPCNIISCCGAYIESNNEVIQSLFISANIIKEIVEEVEKHRPKAGFLITTCDFMTLAKLWSTNPFEKIAFFLYRLKNGRYNEEINLNKKLFNQFINNQDQKAYKMYILLLDFVKGDRYNMAKILEEKFGQLVDITTSRSGVEISVKGVNKGNSVEKLTQQMGYLKEEVAVVGDDSNDIPMFEIFENSFVLKHGYAPVLDSAKYQIKNFKQLFNIIKEED